MTDDIDFYDLLEVSENASQDDIKQAFREKVRIYHPDLNDDTRAQAQFTALKKAYDILGDPVERQAYDRLGHENYVAKRTSGLPSPDLWKKNVDSGDESTGTDSTDAAETTSASSSARSNATGGTKTGTGGRTKATSGGGTTRSTTRGTSTSSSASQTGTRAKSSTTTQTRSQRTGASKSATAGTATGGHTNTTRSRTATPSSESGPLTNNAVVRWWRNQNFAWPLIWTSIIIYVAGLVHFGLENEPAIVDVSQELATIGGDMDALAAFLTESRHGIETVVAFVTGVELLEAPLEETLWYGALAGVIVLSLVIVLVARIAWRTETWGRVSFDETIVVAIALATTTTVLGGPLLAGAVLMPLLFGVVIYRTRQLPGWSPSYLYLVCVCAPLVGFGLTAGGYSNLALDAALFVIVPVLGAIGLPIRFTIRKRLGR